MGRQKHRKGQIFYSVAEGTLEGYLALETAGYGEDTVQLQEGPRSKPGGKRGKSRGNFWGDLSLVHGETGGRDSGTQQRLGSATFWKRPARYTLSFGQLWNQLDNWTTGKPVREMLREFRMATEEKFRKRGNRWFLAVAIH